MPNRDKLSPESQVAMHPVQQSDVDLDNLPEDKIICVDDNVKDSNRLVSPLYTLHCILMALLGGLVCPTGEWVEDVLFLKR